MELLIAYIQFICNQLLGSVGYALGYAIEAFCVAYAVRKGWDAGKR